MFKSKYLNDVMETVTKRNPAEPEFLQAVKEVLESLEPVIEAHPEFAEKGIVERIVEPCNKLFHNIFLALIFQRNFP